MAASIHGGRPRTYDPTWTRRGQRWPKELLEKVDYVARQSGLTREQFVVEVMDQWFAEYEKSNELPKQSGLW